MKTNIRIPLLVSLVGAYMLYQEGVGINILIYTIVFIGAIAFISSRAAIRHTRYVIVSLLIVAGLLAIYPQKLTYTFWLVNYILFLAMMFSDFRALLLPVYGLSVLVKSPKTLLFQSKGMFSGATASIPSIRVFLISSFIFILFFLLYASSNPLIYTYLDKLDFSFIDIGFIIVVVLLFSVHFAFIQKTESPRLSVLNHFSEQIHSQLPVEKDKEDFKIAKYSIILLSVVLTLINLSDLIVMLTGKLPEGMSYADYVHQGFYSLLLSMSLAIGMIIYFFRAGINFHKHIALLKKVVIYWVFQNILLGILTFQKNMMYVVEYGLTYKRIAVFVILIAIFTGFSLLYLKVKERHTSLFYFNHSAVMIYSLMFFISFFPMDILITKYNLSQSNTTDINYLIRLSNPDFKDIKQYISDNDQLVLDYGSTYKLNKMAKKVKNDPSWKSWNYYENIYSK